MTDSNLGRDAKGFPVSLNVRHRRFGGTGRNTENAVISNETYEEKIERLRIKAVSGLRLCDSILFGKQCAEAQLERGFYMCPLKVCNFGKEREA